MGKYFKAEWKYFLVTKTYIYYIMWAVSAVLATVLARIQYRDYRSESDLPFSVFVMLFQLGFALLSFIAPLVIVILYVQSITNVFTEGAYRNVFSLNVSRVKWLVSKTIIYLLMYFGVVFLVKICNELILLTYPSTVFNFQKISSMFIYENLTITLLVLFIEVSFVLMYHGLATWLSVMLRKTVPVVLIIVFGTIISQMLSSVFLTLITSLMGRNGHFLLFALPLPGSFNGLVSLAYINSDVSVVYFNLSLTILFQLLYGALFFFLGYRKIKRLDF